MNLFIVIRSCVLCNLKIGKTLGERDHPYFPFIEKNIKVTISHEFVVLKILKTCRSRLSPTGVKPFKCNVCDSSFTTNGSLNRHMIIHIKSFKCSVCDESFRTSLLCKRHMKKEHAVDDQSKDSWIECLRTGSLIIGKCPPGECTCS